MDGCQTGDEPEKLVTEGSTQEVYTSTGRARILQTVSYLQLITSGAPGNAVVAETDRRGAFFTGDQQCLHSARPDFSTTVYNTDGVGNIMALPFELLKGKQSGKLDANTFKYT